MKIRLLLVLVLSVFGAKALADDHAKAGPFYAFYHLQSTNPAALIAAMDKFWASDCGKQYPADVGFSEEVFNGGNTSTHFIINTFQNSDDQAKAAEIMRSCPAALTFLEELYASGTQAINQYMGPAAVDENDWKKFQRMWMCVPMDWVQSTLEEISLLIGFGLAGALYLNLVQ